MSDDAAVIAARRAVDRLARRPVQWQVGVTAFFVVGAGVFFALGWWPSGLVWLAFAAWHGYGIRREVRRYRQVVAEFEAKVAEIQRLRDETRKQFDETMRRLLAPWN